jgi:hypothetical protein
MSTRKMNEIWNFLQQDPGTGGGALSGYRQSFRIKAFWQTVWPGKKPGMGKGCGGSRSRLLNSLQPLRVIYVASLSIFALASEPANADSSTSPPRDRSQNTPPNPGGFASQNVCGGDFGMLQHAEDVVNDNLRPDGSEIYRCTNL